MTPRTADQVGRSLGIRAGTILAGSTSAVIPESTPPPPDDTPLLEDSTLRWGPRRGFFLWPTSLRGHPVASFPHFLLSAPRSLSDLDLSTAANDAPASASFSAPKNPQRIPANTPPGFRGLRPRICLALLRLVTNGNVRQAPSGSLVARRSSLAPPSPSPLSQQGERRQVRGPSFSIIPRSSFRVSRPSRLSRQSSFSAQPSSFIVFPKSPSVESCNGAESGAMMPASAQRG